MDTKLIKKRNYYEKELEKTRLKIEALEKKYKKLEFKHYKTCVEINNQLS